MPKGDKPYRTSNATSGQKNPRGGTADTRTDYWVDSTGTASTSVREKKLSPSAAKKAGTSYRNLDSDTSTMLANKEFGMLTRTQKYR